MSILHASDKPHILVVDDDDRLRALLKKFLSEHGFIVTTAASTQEAAHFRNWYLFDLIVLDVMMPNQTGLQWLAAENITTPVLMLSALGESQNRIDGLEVGAEDYLSKPFEPKELVLRIKAILRRTSQQQERSRLGTFGDYVFDCQLLTLKRHEQLVPLTTSERDMLQMLVENAGSPVSRDKLATLLPQGSNERSVDVQMSRLRKKMEDADGKVPYLQTVRGAGYVLHVQ